MTKILIIHGPNLNLLGKREPGVYGTVTIDELNKNLRQIAKKKGATLEIFQSNHEGEIVDKIGKAKNRFAALLINPAAYTHTSVAIRDAISATDIPTVEVHLSNIYSREDFRRTSLVAPVAKGQISGFGIDSYIYGLEAAIKLTKKKT
ncbi:MAG: type II 3-dehydroquinate dehydratase [Candidatus Omnitrophica bacterium]|nr:type II 3-dehydroquinate dehydratase [Candidatus Omnitrophota bacterium]